MQRRWRGLLIIVLIGVVLTWRLHIRSLNGALIDAAWRGDTATVKSLLDRGANLNARDRAGRTPLFMAAWIGSGSTVKILLANGAEVNTWSEAPPGYSTDGEVYGPRDFTPLRGAVVQGHPDVVRLLIAHGANVNTRDDISGSLLQEASWYLSVGVADENGHRYTPRDGASKAIVQMLKTAGAKE